MTRDANQDGLIVGVAGAGAMGRGIAQVAAGGGCKVKLYDSKDGAPAEAKEFINKMLGRNVEKGRMAQEDAERAVARIEVVEGMSGLADCDCVVEAVVENLEIKHAVFKELESSGQDIVLFALKGDDWESLTLNLADIMKLVQQQKSIIAAYKNYYEDDE